MKKVLFTLLLAMSCLIANAQFVGGFYHNDPNAWFDKEPYFACLNNASNYGYGINYTNVSVVINNKDVYSFPYSWNYGTYIIVDNNTVKFSSGDMCSVYIGNQCIGTWRYSASSNLPKLKMRGTGKILKSVWKYIKRIR